MLDLLNDVLTKNMKFLIFEKKEHEKVKLGMSSKKLWCVGSMRCVSIISTSFLWEISI